MMEKRTRLIGIVVMMCFMSVLIGCSKKDNEVKTAQITSVVNNKETLQENALYHFDNGKLDVYVNFSPFENPNTNPSDSDYDKKLDKTITDLNKEFPNEHMTKDSFDNKIEKSFKNVTVSVDKTNRKVILSGKGITKEFTMSDSNDNRLVDDLGNEYELSYTKE